LSQGLDKRAKQKMGGGGARGKITSKGNYSKILDKNLAKGAEDKTEALNQREGKKRIAVNRRN